MNKRTRKFETFEDPDKVVGYEVEVEFQFNSGKPNERFHWMGRESACRRKGMLKSNAVRIASITPVTAQEWLRAYGNPHERL